MPPAVPRRRQHTRNKGRCAAPVAAGAQEVPAPESAPVPGGELITASPASTAASATASTSLTAPPSAEARQRRRSRPARNSRRSLGPGGAGAGCRKPGPESLKVNVLASCGEGFHLDTFDMCLAKARSHFIAAAAAELGVEADTVKRDVGLLLLKLEELQEAERKRAAAAPKGPTLSEAERDAALALPKTPNLLQRILEDFHRCG